MWPGLMGSPVYETTIDGQANYFAEHYPARQGIKTYFITGDDHESWFAPGFNIGAYLQFIAESEPHKREDLIYIGHVEADVAIQVGKAARPTIVKVMHPGGGSSYARSYKGQKQVESFEGGEKPDILVCGHYHVSNFMNDRNIHVINLPGFQSQTIFARKKNLRMEVGGAVMEFKVRKQGGSVTRFRFRANPVFHSWILQTVHQVGCSNSQGQVGTNRVKVCTRCKGEKREADFRISSRPDMKSGSYTFKVCKACERAAQNVRAATHEAKLRKLVTSPESPLTSLTVAQWNKILSAQDGCCAICRTEVTRPFTDHNHETGQVRGLLCGPCNMYIGHIREDAAILDRARDYLLFYFRP